METETQSKYCASNLAGMVMGIVCNVPEHVKNVLQTGDVI